MVYFGTPVSHHKVQIHKTNERSLENCFFDDEHILLENIQGHWGQGT